jgi:hypothetical protein
MNEPTHNISTGMLMHAYIHVYSHTACMHTNICIHKCNTHTHTRPYTYSHKPQWSTPEMIEKFLNLQQAEILKRQLCYTRCCQRALRALLQNIVINILKG